MVASPMKYKSHLIQGMLSLAYIVFLMNLDEPNGTNPLITPKMFFLL